MKKRPPEFASTRDMGFDIDGKPLPMSGPDVRRRVLSAFDDPASELVLVILRHKGDLLMQVMGEPSQETLADVRQLLQQFLDGYANVLKGQ